MLQFSKALRFILLRVGLDGVSVKRVALPSLVPASHLRVPLENMERCGK